jgi:hypothetical protein
MQRRPTMRPLAHRTRSYRAGKDANLSRWPGLGRNLPFSKRAMTSRDLNIVYSGLSRNITVDGVTVDVKIYRLEGDPQLVLEMLNEQGTSAV